MLLHYFGKNKNIPIFVRYSADMEANANKFDILGV